MWNVPAKLQHDSVIPNNVQHDSENVLGFRGFLARIGFFFLIRVITALRMWDVL